MSLATPLTDLAELAGAESDLAADLASRDADWSRSPSALPGWSRSHVVGHLAGNAYALVNLTRWAATGTETPMYPSMDARATEIDRRAALDWGDLLEDLALSAQTLRQALQSLSEPVAARDLRMGSGASVNVCDVAAVRIREVQVHRVDLAGEYRAEGWTTRFTLRTFGELAPFFHTQREVPVTTLRATDTGNCWVVGGHGPDLIGSEADLLAWLIGRPHGGVRSSDDSSVPTAPTWV